jgi:hypothetical protein
LDLTAVAARPERQPGQRLDGHRVGGHAADVADQHPALAALERGAGSPIEAGQITANERSVDG